jgi:hypothetical protein
MVQIRMGNGGDKVSPWVANIVFLGFGILIWALCVYIIVLIVRTV